MGRTAWIAAALVVAGCASPETAPVQVAEPVVVPVVVPEKPNRSCPPSDIEKAFRDVDQSPPGLEPR